YEAIQDWKAAKLEEMLRSVAEEAGVSAGKIIHPTRLALTGTTVGAPLFDVVELLGKEATLRRLMKFREAIQPPTPAESDVWSYQARFVLCHPEERSDEGSAR